jgi:hypothetical protein
MAVPHSAINLNLSLLLLSIMCTKLTFRLSSCEIAAGWRRGHAVTFISEVYKVLMILILVVSLAYSTSM